MRWQAPEVLQFGHYSSSSDVWSLGITIWEILYMGGLPYWSTENEDVSLRLRVF